MKLEWRELKMLLYEYNDIKKNRNYYVGLYEYYYGPHTYGVEELDLTLVCVDLKKTFHYLGNQQTT